MFISYRIAHASHLNTPARQPAVYTQGIKHNDARALLSSCVAFSTLHGSALHDPFDISLFATNDAVQKVMLYIVSYDRRVVQASNTKHLQRHTAVDDPPTSLQRIDTAQSNTHKQQGFRKNPTAHLDNARRHPTFRKHLGL